MRFSSLLLAACLVFSCATTSSVKPNSTYETIVNSEDRTAEDKKLDAGRKPAAFLTAIEVQPGMKVGELFSGGGYTTELLSRAVGPTGVIYGQNPKWVLERFAGKAWADRLSREVNRVVVRVDRELDEPFPPEANGTLDVVVTNANYHDAVWTKVNTAKMNGAVFAALKPGGRYVISDSSAKLGSGAEAVESLHRIDEAYVQKEVEAAGFKLIRKDDSLRNPDDTRDWSASPREAGERRGTSDRFILVFAKP